MAKKSKTQKLSELNKEIRGGQEVGRHLIQALHESRKLGNPDFEEDVARLTDDLENIITGKRKRAFRLRKVM